jgi:ABC-type glycerol-3-phosphate transport system substrate-binding protein
MGPESNVIVINSDLFQGAGLDPRGKDIKTWDDLARIAQQFTQRSGAEVTRSGYLISNMNLPRLAGWSNTTAAGLFNEDQTKAFYTAPGVAQAMEFQFRLHNGLQVTHPVTMQGRPGGEQALLSGAAAMVDGISSVPTLWFTRTPEFKYWQVPYPQGPGGKGPNSVTWMNMVVFDKTSRNAERAFEFVRWFCASNEVTVLKLKMTDAPSPVRAFYQTDEWKSRVRENPVLQTRLDIAELTGVYPYRRNNDQSTEINPLLQDALVGKTDIRNALQLAQAVADRVLAQ